MNVKIEIPLYLVHDEHWESTLVESSSSSHKRNVNKQVQEADRLLLYYWPKDTHSGGRMRQEMMFTFTHGGLR